MRDFVLGLLSRPKQPRTRSQARTVGALTVMLACFQLTGSTQALRAQSESPAAQADFTLDASATQFFDILCTPPLIVVRWTTATENHVDAFKVHRINLSTGQTGWVNPVPLLAKGANRGYAVIDNKLSAEALYQYTLYGFVAADGYDEPIYLLSEALAAPLPPTVQPWCLYLPTVRG